MWGWTDSYRWALGLCCAGVAGWTLCAYDLQANPIVPNDGATELSGDCSASCSIEGGIEAGVNRFHSFSEFSIPQDAAVTVINNNPEVENAIARVNGGNPTEIFGALTSGGIAPDFNLFLINPSGLFIGEGASINLQGAFIGSTADTIEFGSLGEWESERDTPPAGLTIHPSALLFSRLQPQPITIDVPVEGDANSTEFPNSISTGRGSSLILSGSDITISRGKLSAPEGSIVLAAVGTDGGRLGLNLFPSSDLSPAGLSSEELTLQAISQPVDFSNNPGRGDIRIGTEFDPTAQPFPLPSASIAAPEGGNVVLRGANFSIEQAFVGQPGDRLPPAPPGGSTSIFLDASETATFRNSGVFFGDTSDSFEAGFIVINVRETVLLEGFRPAIASRTFGSGQGGSIQISSSRLLLSGSARIAADTGGEGNGGFISIDTQTLRIDGNDLADRNFEPAINTFSVGPNDLGFSGGNNIRLPDIAGRAGRIEIQADRVQLIGEGSIGTISNNDSGGAGSILVRANNLQLSTKSTIAVDSNFEGEAGDLRILSGTVEIAKNSSLSASSDEGLGGDISLTVKDILLLSRASEVSAAALGEGGNIKIEASFIVAGPNDNNISAASVEANTGDVNLTARDVLGFTLNNQPDPSSSDITATSTITFDRLQNRDLTRESIAPAIIDPTIDPSQLVYDSCKLDAGETLEDIGQFIYVGRGGLPLGANDPLQAGNTHRPWVEHPSSSEESRQAIISNSNLATEENVPAATSNSTPFVEAQGFGRNQDGQLVLTENPQSSSHTVATSPTHQCGDLVTR